MNKLNLSADSSKLQLSYGGHVLSYSLETGLLIKIFNGQPVVAVENPNEDLSTIYDEVKITKGKIFELAFDQEKQHTYLVGELDLVIGEPSPLVPRNPNPTYIVSAVMVINPDRKCCVVDFADNILYLKKGEDEETTVVVLTEKQASTGDSGSGATVPAGSSR